MRYQLFVNLNKMVEERALEDGFHLLDQGYVMEATETFDKVPIEQLRSRSVDVAEAYYQAGKYFLAQKQFPRVIKYFGRARELHQDRPLLNERFQLIRRVEIEIGKARGMLGRCREQIGAVCLLSRNEERTSLLAAARTTRLIRPYRERGFSRPIAVDRVLAVGVYEPYSKGQWTRLIQAYKVRDFDFSLAEPLGFLMAEFLWEHPEIIAKLDVLMPVPPDPKKFTRRGFGPTILLARVVSRYTGIPLREHVIIRKLSDTDTRYASYEQVSASFGLESDRPWLFKGANVLLIEDVITAGRNIHAAAELLKQRGVKEVYALALARTEERHR